MGISEICSLLKFILPEFIVFLCGIAVLCLEITKWKYKNMACAMFCTMLFLAAMAILMIELKDRTNQILFQEIYIITPLATLGKLVILMAGVFTILASLKYVEIHDLNLAEYLHFLAFSILGMFILMSAHDFLILFLGLELLSFPVYVLTGMKVKNERSCEASLKYMVTGVFSSTILLLGVAFIYGTSANTNIGKFTALLASNQQSPELLLGLVLVLTGFFFKLSLVPFHAWTPDVYEGAPTTITAFMSVTIKVSVFLAFIRIFAGLHMHAFLSFIAVIALLSIVIGNFYGLTQGNVKRLIAYSSIAHAGYIMLGFLDPAREQGIYAMVFYLINYTFMNLAALFVLVCLTTKEKYVENLSDLKGIGLKKPFLGFVMMVAMFSLAGLPPTPGFIAKFYVLKSALQSGYLVIVVLALISTLIALYYYTKVIAVMYIEETDAVQESKEYSIVLGVIMVIVILGLFYIGLFPNQLLKICGYIY